MFIIINGSMSSTLFFRQAVQAVFVVHPNATFALQASDEVGVVVIDFEVVAVERLFFDGNADHGLPVVVIIQ